MKYHWHERGIGEAFKFKWKTLRTEISEICGWKGKIHENGIGYKNWKVFSHSHRSKKGCQFSYRSLYILSQYVYKV